MLDQPWLINTLQQKISQPDKLMVVLLNADESGMFEVQIKKFCTKYGLDASTWSIPAILGSAKKEGYVAFVKSKWQLTRTGRDSLKEKGLIPPQTPLTQTSLDLRSRLSTLNNPEAKAFVEDAILCLEANALRPAVVMSWLGAVAVLRAYVMDDLTRLSDFNAKALARKKSWEPATEMDHLSELSDSDLLDILEDSRIITHDVMKELKHCLDRRNTCAHPNSFKIGEQQVAAHIEALILNVYAKF